MALGIPLVTLNSGHTMPVIGLGTVSEHYPSDLVSTFLDAVEAGYRHFDTAALYGNEQSLGQAMAEALERGLVRSRDELFITTKLWCTDAHPDLVLPALQKSLCNLGLEYVDLYLIHWPVRLKSGEIKMRFPKEDLLPFEMRPTWEAMEECHRLGLVKSIGVSNFSSKKLSQLLDHASIPPAVNQVEMNASWHQKRLRKFCEEHGIHVTAWSPLAANGTAWGSNSVMENPVLKQIADSKGKTIAQVALRWLYEQKVSMVPKSYNRVRMKENLQIFDWELSEEDLNMIDKLPQCKVVSGDFFVSENGQYRSLEELYDGEI